MSTMIPEEYLPPLPLGYRFRPTDEELILDYLYPKMKGTLRFKGEVMEFDIYGEEDSLWSWLLPDKSTDDDDACLYLFTRLKKKSNERGKRTCRVTSKGTWKAQRDDAIHIPGTKIHIGSKRSFKFVPRDNSAQSRWIMHEFRVDGQLLPKIEGLEDKDYVICKIKPERRKRRPPEEGGADRDHASIFNAAVDEYYNDLVRRAGGLVGQAEG